jgi:spermidine/putrescine-binding protein
MTTLARHRPLVPSRRARKLLTVLLAGGLLAAGCGKAPSAGDPQPPGTRPGEGGATATPAAGGPALESELNVFIWSAYLPDSVVASFTAKTGTRVQVDVYDSNEALLAKLQSGVAGYDLVVPSDYLVKILIAEGLLQQLDRSLLPGLDVLDPRLLGRAYDPGNDYTLPYAWGTTGFAYDRQKVGGELDSWSALFDPRFSGRILMLDDVREAFGAALALRGRSINERDPQALAEAAAALRTQKALVRTYDSGDFANILAAGDVDLAQGYSGQLAQVVRDAPERFAYVVPKEGGTLWIDNLAIPTGARHLAAAHAFIAHLMDPHVAAEVANAIGYASANLAARAHIDPAILADPAVYPPDEVLARCALIEDLGETTAVLDQYWTEIKAE